MSKQSNLSPYFFKDVDILYEGAGYINETNIKKHHNFFRILYFESASATLVHEGVGYTIQPRQIAVIRPHTVYEIKNSNNYIKYYDFNFLDKKSIYNIHRIFKNEFIFDMSNELFFDQCFVRILDETNKDLGSKLLLLSGIGLSLLSIIFRKMENYDEIVLNHKDVSRNNIFLLSEIESKLNEDFINNCKIYNLAYAVGISENKLYKVIKDTYDISPKEWILEMKIQKIKIMLVERHNYHEIAERLCFCSISHMNSTFKKRVGCTPNTYLKRYSNK